MSLFAELKRRNVFKVAGAYLALGWVVVQATATLAPAFHLPDAALPLVTWIGVIGFPFVVVFSWVYELTPDGLKRESEVDRSQSITHVTSKRLDTIIIAMLALAIAVTALDRLLPEGEAPDAAAALPKGTGTSHDNNVAEAASADAVPVPAQSAAPAPSEKSIAVLPFVNMSPDKDQEYFADGISEELLNLLAKIPELKVAARTSSFSYKGSNTRIAQIGQELNVANVLEGSVRKAGNTVRITAQLVRAADGYHLWSETWDRDISDIFAVQDEIAGSVVEQMKIKLLGAAPKAREVNPQAYALFLQARQLRRQGTAEGYVQAIALSQQALTLEPDYAAAWDELASAYMSQANSGLRPVDEAYALARDAVSKALASDPDFAKAHDALGWIAMAYDGNLAAAAQHYQRALALDPTNVSIIANAAVLTGTLGRVDLAIALMEYQVAHDPIAVSGRANLGGFYLAAKRYDEAIASFRTALRLSPGIIGAQAYIGLALLFKGETEAALAEAQKESDEITRLYALALVYQALGRQVEADAALAELTQKYEKQSSYSIASVFSYRNEVDRAFEWLDKAVANHDSSLVNLATADTDPTLDNVRNDPRWLPFLTKLGKAPEQLAAIKFDVKLPQQ